MGGPRYVPIIFTADGAAAQQVVKGLTSAFHQLDDTAEKTSTGGLRSVFIQADLASRAIAFLTREAVDSAREYLQFGKELTNLNTLLDNSSALPNLRNGILELDPALGHTSELARGMYQAISSGVAAEESLDAIADSAKAARAGLASTFETVDMGTSVMASYNLQGKDLATIYDKAFETVKRGKVEFPQLAQNIGQVSSFAAEAGVTIDEMFAAIATGSRTTRPAQVIEGLRTALSNVVKPSKDAKELAEELGIEFSATALKSKGLAQFLKEVSEATQGDIDKLAVLFGDVQGLNVVLKLTGANSKQFADDLRGIASASGTVEEAFQKQRQSLSAQFEEFKVSFERSFIQNFLKVEPLLTGTLSLVNKYPSVFGAAIIVLIGLAAAHALYNTQLAISAASSIPKLISGLTSVVFWMGNYRTALMAVASAKVIGDVTPFLAASLGWAALAAAVALVVYQIYSAATATRELTQVNTEAAISVSKRVNSTTAELQSLEALRGTVSRTAEQQNQLEEAYAALNGTARGRIAVIDDEAQRLAALIEEKKRNLQLDLFTQQSTSYQLVNNLIIALEDQAKAQRELNAAREDYNRATANRQAADNDFALADALKYQRKAADEANTALEHLGRANGSVEQASRQIVDLSRAADFNIDRMFEQARTAGLVSGSFNQARTTVEGFARSQNAATSAANEQTNALNNQTNAVNQQADALKHLKAIQDSMSRRRDSISAATIDIINNAKSAAEAKQQVANLYKNDAGFRSEVDADRRIKANQQAVSSYLDPTAGGGRAATRRQVSAADQAAQASIKQAEIDARTAERLYREATTISQREYDLRQISLQDFVTEQIAAEETLKTFKLSALQDERTAALKLSKSTARETKIKEIAEREAQIVSDSNINIQRIKDNAYKVELDALRSRVEQQLTLREEVDRREIEIVREMAERRGLTYEEAEREILAINTAAFSRRLEFLHAEERANLNNVEERLRINDKIKFLTEQQVSLQEEAGRRIIAGRERDLANLKNYGAEIRAFAEENARMATEIGDARLDREERLGANPRYSKQERMNRAIDAENALNARNLDRISATFDIDFTKKSAEEVAQIQRLFHERLELEEIRHQDRLQEIREQPLVEYLQKVEKVATEIGDIFGDAFAGLFEKGRSFWTDMGEGFRRMFLQIVRDFIASKVKEKLLSLFNPTKDGDTASNSAGGGFSPSSIFGSIKNLFSGGNNNGNGGGFINGLRNLLGFGSNGGVGSALTGGFAGGASPAATIASGGASSLTTASQLAAGGGFFGFGASTAAASTSSAGAAAASTGAAAGSSSMLGSMTALMTNPWTIGIAAAALGTFALFKLFGNRTEKALRKQIAQEYSIQVKDMAVLKQVKEMGESVFGKGNVRKHLQETVRLDQVKELLANYAESTGQQSSKLTTNAQLADPTNAANQFVRRITGGVIPGSTRGLDYVPVLADGGEYVNNTATVRREGLESFSALNEGRARIVSNNVWRKAVDKLRAKMQAENSNAPAAVLTSSTGSGRGGNQSGGNGVPPSLLAALVTELRRTNDINDRWEQVDEGALVERGARKNPQAIGEANNTALQRSSALRTSQAENLGMRN